MYKAIIPKEDYPWSHRPKREHPPHGQKNCPYFLTSGTGLQTNPDYHAPQYGCFPRKWHTLPPLTAKINLLKSRTNCQLFFSSYFMHFLFPCYHSSAVRTKPLPPGHTSVPTTRYRIIPYYKSYNGADRKS